MRDIVDLQMREVGGRLREQGIELSLTDVARDWLADKGYDPQFGARPLRRALQRYIENPLSIQLLSGEVEKGAIVADIEDDAMVFRPAGPRSEEPELVEEPLPEMAAEDA
jgi:ATP-dependent Clp protease ATP-binding subunit ClpC